LYEFGSFRLDPEERRLAAGGTPISLTPKAFDILLVLARRAPRLVTKEQLLREVWPDAFVEESNLTVHISAIRKALGEAEEGGERYIETVPKRGYRFVAPVRSLEETFDDSDSEASALASSAAAVATPAAVAVAAADDGGSSVVSSSGGPGTVPQALPTRELPRRRLWPRLIGAIPVVAAAIVLAAVALSTSSARRGGLAWERMATQGRLSLLFTSETRAASPGLSADGRMVAYVATDERGQSDLYLTQVSGGGKLRLTDDEAREEHPRFSPDGQHILFTRRPRSGPPLVCLLPALGGHAATVVTTGTDAAWSPKGERVAFINHVRDDGPEALFTSALDGSDVRLVMEADGSYPFLRNPAWSRDGQELAVVRGSGGVAGEIWLVAVDGGAPRKFTKDGSAVWSDSPTFTADGGGLVHASNRGGATNLWIQMLTENIPARLTTGPGPDLSPTVSQGGAVAFINSRGREELIVHGLGAGGNGAGGGATRTLLTHSPYLWAPVFSPDGTEIAFSRSEVDGSWHVWTMPAAGGEAQRLTSGPLGELHPRYTPDGRSLIYQSWGKPRRIWRVPRQGGTAVALTSGETDDGYADPSPDGRSVAFARTEGDERIYIAPIQPIEGGSAGGTGGTAAPRRLTEHPSTVPRWSPDGKWIAFSPGRGFDRGIFVIAPDGRGERRLTDEGGWPVWWPDGTRISYITIGPDAAQQIWTVPLSGGAPQRLDTPMFFGSNYPFDISRDGRRLVSSRGVRVSHEIWLLEPPGGDAATRRN
jgi:Tol biopolymer transport system component/DNA-binding winged helix-turn-helix (wHTH) protein